MHTHARTLAHTHRYTVTSIVTCVVLELVSLNPYRKEGIFIPGELDFGRVIY